MALATIQIDKIETGQRLRDISPAQVEALAASIAEVGLLHPISVFQRKIIRGGISSDGYGLVAGAHRLEACRSLGLVEVEASVVALSELERQIAECDENLCGSVLTPSERARFTKRRKEAYEALHPETRATSQGGEGRRADTRRQLGDELAPRFTEDTASKTGQSERAVQRDAERGAKIDDAALSIVKGTDLDTGTYLDKLKSVPKDEQVKTVREQLRALREKPTDSANKIKLDADIRQRAARSLAEMTVEFIPADALDHWRSNFGVTTTKDYLIELANITGQSIMDRSAAE